MKLVIYNNGEIRVKGEGQPDSLSQCIGFAVSQTSFGTVVYLIEQRLLDENFLENSQVKMPKKRYALSREDERELFEKHFLVFLEDNNLCPEMYVS